MKAYIGHVDWTDEGDVFFFSVESEERLQAMKELINIYSELGLLDSQETSYGAEDFIDKARDISKEELAVFEKFNVSGFDIYERVLDTLCLPFEWDRKARKCIIPDYITQEDLDRIKPVYLKLFKPNDWENIQWSFDEDQLCKILKPWKITYGPEITD